MLHLSDSRRYYLYSDACDFRKGFEGLCGLVLEHFGQLLRSGSVFIFFNRRRDRVKLLCWEQDGFSIYYKRLEQGTYELPQPGNGQISCRKVCLILSGIVLSSVNYRPRYGQKK